MDDVKLLMTTFGTEKCNSEKQQKVIQIEPPAETRQEMNKPSETKYIIFNRNLKTKTYIKRSAGWPGLSPGILSEENQTRDCDTKQNHEANTRNAGE